MWVNRPYIDGLFTLWHGFGLGARDGNFERFESWIRSERFPAPDDLGTLFRLDLLSGGQSPAS